MTCLDVDMTWEADSFVKEDESKLATVGFASASVKLIHHDWDIGEWALGVGALAMH